jgi:hypothetical protein
MCGQSTTADRPVTLSSSENANIPRKFNDCKMNPDPLNSVAEYKDAEVILTNQNCVYEEIKSRLKSVIACYHSDQNSCLPTCYPEIQRLKYSKLNFAHCFVWVWNVDCYFKGRTWAECV